MYLSIVIFSRDIVIILLNIIDLCKISSDFYSATNLTYV